MSSAPTPRLRLLAATFAVGSLTAVSACSDDAPHDEPDAGDVLDVVDTAETSEEDAPSDVFVPPVPEGVEVAFDLSVGTGGATPETWYDFPFPADTRLEEDGTLAVGFPNPQNQALVADLMLAADDLRGYSLVPVAWFKFDGPVAPSDLDDTITASTSAPALLVNVDPDSPDYLELAPVIAKTLDADSYVPEDVLAVAAFAGWVLEPETTYAFVITRAWGDPDGAELGVPEALWNMANGASSGDVDIDATFAPLWDALGALDIPSTSVAAATVFTTGDPVRDVAELTEALRDRYSPTIENLAIDADDGADHERFCELHGTMTVPEFQEGTPPFNTGGLFVPGEDGLPVEQGETAIPVVINLPLQEMPAEGFPLVMYFHGSGGVSTQVVDRGEDVPGGGDGGQALGPAHVLARHGFATVGSAHPVNPERLAMVGQGATGFDYLNLSNLKSFRDTFRQGIIEQRLFLDALLELEIDPSVVEGCAGISLPDGADAYVIDPTPILAMGQSMGGMFTNLMAPVDPRIEAVVPTGAGGLWSYFILVTDLISNVGTLVANILRVADLTHVHPALHVLQLAWEPVEAFAYVPRLAHNPLPGHPVRSIYEPVGDQDSYFPRVVFDRIALAYRNQQAGEVVWDSMQAALQVRGLDGLAEYPVANNRTSADGTAYTGVVVQYPWDGVNNGHNIFQYMDEVKRQYGCFFETYFRTGTATVPDGTDGGLLDPCPGL